MLNSMPLSDMSSTPLRIELRPSRAVCVALVLLALLAAIALLLSAAPVWILAVVPLLLAFAWPRVARNGWRELVLRADGSAVALAAAGEEQAIEPCRLQHRGLLTALTIKVRGRMQSYLFTPGTLGAGDRRRLVLWFDRHVSSIDETEAPAHV